MSRILLTLFLPSKKSTRLALHTTPLTSQVPVESVVLPVQEFFPLKSGTAEHNISWGIPRVFSVQIPHYHSLF